jgi:hypothetical protein
VPVELKKAAPVAANENATTLAGEHVLLEAIKAFQPAIEAQPTEALKQNPRKARLHAKKQVQQLAASITTFGFVVPIVIDEDGIILAGHGRYLAAKLGLCHCADHPSCTPYSRA